MRCLYIALGVLLLGAGRGAAAVIRVPQDAPTIAWAVTVAESNDEIVIRCGTYYEWGITIDRKVLTIRGEQSNGECVIINALGQDRVLNLGFSIVRFDGLTLTNGATAGRGGAFELYGPCELEFKNCRLIGNTASAGGAAWIDGGDSVVDLDHVSVVNNIATDSGGGIYVYAGGLFCTDTAVTGNEANIGGGIAMRYGAVNLNRTLLEANSATSAGGALFAEGGDLNVVDCSIRSNGAPVGGGYSIAGDTRAYFNFTDLADSGYGCSASAYVALICCSYPIGICGTFFFDSDCLPVPNSTVSWGTLKATFR